MTGAIVWFTGLPASGKTTLALRVRDRVLPRTAVVLDSDELREVLGTSDYSAGGRDQFYRSVGELAMLLERQGHLVLVAATGARRAYRDAVRARSAHFLEVWVRATAAECEARDRKGLYTRARAGAAPDLPGLGATYEPPRSPEVIATGGHDDVAIDAILARL